MDLPADIGARVGLLGGTFDPVHLGHLDRVKPLCEARIAEHIRKQLAFDAVVFIPAADPPHKEKGVISSLHHRQRMLTLALAARPGYRISLLEAERPGPSYSVDTLRTLKAHFVPGTSLYFITGADAFLDLRSWKEYGRLLDYAHIVVVNRDRYDEQSIFLGIRDNFPLYRRLSAGEFAGPKGSHRIFLTRMEPVAVSATMIRQHVAEGRAIDGLVPAVVADYIREEGLYKKKE